MVDHHDYLALDWVSGEIQETLNQAQQTLESYVENPADSSRMRFCQTYLHQVHGTLKMVEFYGAALLAEEMEKLAEALLGKHVASETDAQEVLMRAILQLPQYLDRVQIVRRDLPVVLLPLLNDLRAVRGEALLTETSLFKPDLSTLSTKRQEAPADGDGNFPELAKKLRQMYQIAMLGLLRGQETAQQLVYMARVFARLEQASGTAPLSPLWSVAAALVEALRDKGLEQSVALKMILGQVDRVIRQVSHEGTESLQQLPPPELLKNLLYYVARATSTTPRVEQVRRRFRLEDALPSEDFISEERARMTGPDQAAMASVVGALSEELGKVKTALERHIQEGARDAAKLEEQVSGLKPISDTLAVLGLGQPRALVERQIQTLRTMIESGETLEAERLMDVAGALLDVESALAALTHAGHQAASQQVPEHIARARDAVLRECHTGLEEAKDGIVEYIASHWDRQHLAPVPERLRAVRGGLELVQLPRPAAVLRQCVQFIEEKLLPEGKGNPEWRSMDTLADAITSVEYYLERLSDDADANDDILAVARNSVAELGYSLPVGELTDLPAHQSAATQVDTDPYADLHAGLQETSSQPQIHKAADRIVDASGQQDADATDITFEELTLDAGAVTDAEPIEAEEIHLGPLPATPPPAPAPAAPTPAVQPAPTAHKPVDDKAEEDSLIDDEIIEIFVEEAGEVIEALNEYFPRWAENTSDKEALTEFRRAFHTLKGSGRMVGALVVGELAWSVENMMNRVIDGTIKPSQNLIALVRKVHGLIPLLVEDFAQRRKPSVDVQPLQAAAHLLAEGGQLDAVPEVGSHVADATAAAETPAEMAAEEEEISLLPEAIPDAEAVSLADESDSNETLLDIFISEAATNLEELDGWLKSLDPDFDEHPLNDLVHRCLHTMKGSARMAGVDAIAELAEPAEKCVKEMINMGVPANQEMLALLVDTHKLLSGVLQQLKQDKESLPGHLPTAEPLIARFQALRAQQDGERGLDSNLLKVFLSEGMSIILDAEDLLDHWAAEPAHKEDVQVLATELKRLSESSRNAGLKEVHELADRLAICFAALNDGDKTVSPDCLTMLKAGQESLVNMMDCLAAGQTVNRDGKLVDEMDAWLAAGNDPAVDQDSIEVEDVALTAPAADEEITLDLPPAMEVQEQTLADTAPAFAETPAPATGADIDLAGIAPAGDEAGETLQDEELGEIFLEEADDILAQAQETLEAWHQDGSQEKVAELQRHLHTLKGGARMAGVSHVGNLAHELEFLYEELAMGQRQADESLYQLLLTCHDRLAAMVDHLHQHEAVFAANDLLTAIEAARHGGSSQPAETPNGTVPPPIAVAEEVVDDLPQTPHIDAVPAEPEIPVVDAAPAAVEPVAAAADTQAGRGASAVERDPELVGIFLEEAEEILEAAGQSLESWLEATDNLVEVQSLQRDLHTLKGGARMAEVPELGNLAHELENLYEGLALGRLEPAAALSGLLQRCHDRLAEMVDGIKGGRALREASDLIGLIHAYMETPDGFELPETTAAAPASAPAEPAPITAAPVSSPVAAAADGLVLPADIDRDILGIFLEEASELMQALDAGFRQWQEEPDNRAHANELKRTLHTLKGGARLAGLTALGDLSHDAESLIENGSEQRDAPFFSRLQSLNDRIANQVEQVQNAARSLAQAPAEEPVQAPVAAAAPAPVVAAPETAPAAARQAPRRGAQRQAQQQPQEVVRIGADVLESLVNLAGETSINRGRVEQEVGEFTAHINEMGNTVERLYEQLRRLDIETEAQIMSNYKQGVEAGHYGDDFDPLEMDQYSELHQITKQLSESASDLLDLKNTLIEQTRDTETLLLQQARINTELQEKLMRTRMVPFSRLVPRLRRIVRQVAGELHKQVEFNVINPEGELDRTLMERIVAPLEHMLRNAVDHGVESVDKRRASGKAETGNINLELGRDGGDVVLILSDDGGGINVDAVRKKAIERGLIAPDSTLTDKEIQQFIFSAGFSTAEKVTQISGRGVGMDVVASDIKQMGGSVSIESIKGKGTRFTVRLPFTLAMNRALLVRVADDSYAIPLTQVEGIVRISPYELEAYLENGGAEGYTYAGQSYQLDYLGQYVHDAARPNLEGVTTPLPVLLLHSHEHQMALVVDNLIGSREIVVKSVGPQLSTVAGISGATILGDGSVVIILDIHSLVRAAHLQQQAIASGKLTVAPQVLQPETIDDVKSDMPLIMVTDDSVTVRKVTTRLLERHGFEVMTAKDGVDAVAKLEERRPDLMLLDIEMPRMDGFEVASHMRHDNRFKGVPIIMITSRTGDKHRERAFDIGVNSYLGKPFQEGELLATIRELLALER